MNKTTIMDKVDNWDAFVTMMHEMEDAWVKESDKIGERAYLGYENFTSKYKFVEEVCKSFEEWHTGICTSVMDAYLSENNTENLGCYEMDNIDCLACACRNRCLCLFLQNAFTDWDAFMKYCINFGD